MASAWTQASGVAEHFTSLPDGPREGVALVVVAVERRPHRVNHVALQAPRRDALDPLHVEVPALPVSERGDIAFGELWPVSPARLPALPLPQEGR